MTALSRFSAGRVLLTALTIALAAALGAAVDWLYTAVSAGDSRAFWILYVIALIAIAVAFLAARRELQRTRAELARRRAESPIASRSRP